MFRVAKSAVFGLVLLAGAVAGSSYAHAEGALERIKRDGVINVGVFNEVPVGYVDENGVLTGESPEVLRLALAEIGDVEMRASVVTEFGALIPGLIAGRFDVIAAGLYIRPARCEQIAFTRPTARYGETLVVAAGNPLGISSYEDVLDNSDATIAVLSGSVELEIVQAMGFPDDRVLQMPITTAVAALRQGRVDAVAVPTVTGQELVAADGGQTIVLPEDFTDPLLDGKPAVNFAGFGVQRQHTELLAALNAALDTVLNSEAHLQAIAPFGFTEAQLPGDVTAEDVCDPE